MLFRPSSTTSTSSVESGEADSGEMSHNSKIIPINNNMTDPIIFDNVIHQRCSPNLSPGRSWLIRYVSGDMTANAFVKARTCMHIRQRS